MIRPTDVETRAARIAHLEIQIRELEADQGSEERLEPGRAGSPFLSGGALVLAILLVSAISVKNEDFEIHPEAVGGNPNDSYPLKLIGDGSTGADRAMSLRNVPTSDSEYRLAVFDNSDNERVSITDDGEFGIGDTTPDYLLDVNGDARIGWSGDSDRIKLRPSDFLSNDDDTYGDHMIENDTTGRGIRIGTSSNELYAFVFIPEGYKATHVRVYGSSTDTVSVVESDIVDGVLGGSLGSGALGNEIDITDMNSDTTNFMIVRVLTNSTADVIYGGYVTIARQ